LRKKGSGELLGEKCGKLRRCLHSKGEGFREDDALGKMRVGQNGVSIFGRPTDPTSMLLPNAGVSSKATVASETEGRSTRTTGWAMR